MTLTDAWLDGHVIVRVCGPRHLPALLRMGISKATSCEWPHAGRSSNCGTVELDRLPQKLCRTEL